MTQEGHDGMLDKEALKALREKRRAWIDAASGLARDAQKAVKAVHEALAHGPDTPPGVARTTGLPPDRALWILASMKKFGQVVEADKDGAYYRYALAQGPQADTE